LEEDAALAWTASWVTPFQGALRSSAEHNIGSEFEPIPVKNAPVMSRNWRLLPKIMPKNLAHVAKMLWRSHYRRLRLYGSCESFLCDAA